MSTVTQEDGGDQPAAPSLGQASKVWLRIGLLSFGGPAAQIALMHREIVDRKRWLSEQQYLNALSFCMLLPGPEAMQLATYAGWRLHGTLGGLIAGLLFVLPGAAVAPAAAARKRSRTRQWPDNREPGPSLRPPQIACRRPARPGAPGRQRPVAHSG
jgi:hypothetical protein